MSQVVSSVSAGGRLEVVHDLPGVGVMAALGFSGVEDPVWASHLLPPDQLRWVLGRWDQASEQFEYDEQDHFNPGGQRSRVVNLHGLLPSVVLEALCGLAYDHQRGTRVGLYNVRGAVQVIRSLGVESIRHLDSSDFETETFRHRWSAWVEMLELVTADPDEEWLRDEVRLQVVMPHYTGREILKLGELKQPWLRDLTMDLMRIRIVSLGHISVVSQIRGLRVLSRFLATRPDGGNNPRVLNDQAMMQFTTFLAADPNITDTNHIALLRFISAALNEARALTLTDRHQLPGSFTVRQQHFPVIAEVVHHERALPIATFRLLLGVDEHLGSSVLDLARDLPKREFDGEVLVQAIHLMANFGRRAGEACVLKADRVRFEETGAAAILYDNFKSGRSQVWLPIDARHAEHLMGWIETLRRRYPNTPLAELALLPASQRNPKGTRSIRSVVLRSKFRILLRLLEQAIVIGHLHCAIDTDLQELCQLQVGDINEDGLQLNGRPSPLSAPVEQILVDYRHDLLTRHQQDTHYQGPRDFPLFPDPTSTHISKSGYKPTPVSRFEALGPDWAKRAGQYQSGGLPGKNLGRERIKCDDITIEMFRHTYLQHAYNATRDIFLVQELADHTNVQVTINAYVQSQTDQLREANDLLIRYRQNILAKPRSGTLPLTSRPAADVRTNNCESPQVLDLGMEGCHKDRQCFECEHYSADPSNIPDIKAEINTCLSALVTAKSEPTSPLQQARLTVLEAKIEGWRRMLRNLETLLNTLAEDERERVDMACQVVSEFRSQVRAGGPRFGIALASLQPPTNNRQGNRP